MAARHPGNARNPRVAVVDMTDIDIPSDDLDLPAQEVMDVAADSGGEEECEGDEDEEDGNGAPA